MAARKPVPRVDPWRCTPSARRRGDPLLATAAPAARWLLVEQPGAWGRHALRESDFNSEVAKRLLEANSVRGIRVQAIRQPPRRTQPDRPRRWAYVDSRVRTPPTLWWGKYSDEAELLDLRLDGSEGDPTTEPIFLVCTHARHDACCALFGRTTFTELSAHHPNRTWETSHVGGDRFAANLVVLPEGLYYGGLDGDSALQVIQAYRAGQLELAYFRGASSHPAPAQAAEHYLRSELGERRISAVSVVSVRPLDLTSWVVRLAHVDGNVFDGEVRSTHAAQLHRLTCSATRPAAARLFELVSLSKVGPFGAP
ncbi:MAG: sucrase ferredoxin [Actinomycetota bacterium]|nr:sucrase ferredoxin [Actinomycetota bacterium]